MKIKCAMFFLVFYGVAYPQNPIVPISKKPLNLEFRESSWNKPLELKSVESVEKIFGKENTQAISRDIDFQKQYVVVFFWRGSGGDKLNYTIAESNPEKITFSIKRGFTRDLREHVQAFALRNNVSWKVLNE